MVELTPSTDAYAQLAIHSFYGLVMAVGVLVCMALMQLNRVRSGYKSSTAIEQAVVVGGAGQPRHYWLKQFAAIALETLLVALTCFHLTLWMRMLGDDESDRLSVLPTLGCLVLSVILWRVLTSGPTPGSRAKHYASLGLATLQVFGLAAIGQIHSVPRTHEIDAADIPGELVAKSDYVALTDKGRQLGLYRRELASEQFAQFVSRIKHQIASVARQAMRRDYARMTSNCHGWVFAGDQHLVLNEDVEHILRDNGYVVQSHAGKGDLVVYRNQDGQIIHTGVVCGFLNDERVLIESKWGVEGCFVHYVNEQPYSQDFTYWRSDRPTHTLNIVQHNSSALSLPLDLATLPQVLPNKDD